MPASGSTDRLVDDDYVDPPRLDIGEQPLEGWPNHRAAGTAVVVVTIPNQSPTLVCLVLDVGLALLPLGVEGIEFLLEPLLGREARIGQCSGFEA
jgi:hypothetical protein